MKEEEICTLCHDGVLIETIQEDEGGWTKKFSCGHTRKLVSRTISEPRDQLHFEDSIATQRTLGPYSVLPISSTVSHTTSALVVSMQQEMYKDALYFVEQAKANGANT